MPVQGHKLKLFWKQRRRGRARTAGAGKALGFARTRHGKLAPRRAHTATRRLAPTRALPERLSKTIKAGKLDRDKSAADVGTHYSTRLVLETFRAELRNM